MVDNLLIGRYAHEQHSLALVCLYSIVAVIVASIWLKNWGSWVPIPPFLSFLHLNLLQNLGFRGPQTLGLTPLVSAKAKQAIAWLVCF
jgi:CHASE2 domain-containing sensor protein